MCTDDETQHAPGDGPLESLSPSGGWMRRIGRAIRRRQDDAAAGPLNAHATLHALPSLLDCSNLPNGVIELVIEDFETPARELIDIHDGQVTLAEPGKCVPWASISGAPAAWAMAFGPKRDTTDLQLTGDIRLARRLLDALPSGA